MLKERGDRDGLEEILPRLQQAVAGIPGVALYLKPVQDVTTDTRVAATSTSTRCRTWTARRSRCRPPG